MRCFVEAANLPRDCGMLLYGEKYAGKLRNPLERLGVESVLVPNNPNIDPCLTGHADLSVLHLGGEVLLLAPYLKGSAAAEELRNCGAELIFPEIEQREAYPGDAQFNLCVVGKHVLYNKYTVPNCVVDLLTSRREAALRPCRQGYTRCASCIVNDHALITADRGVCAAAEAAGLDVLLISPGHIELDGFPYGFLGGASFKLAKDVLAFTGTLDKHPDRSRILHYLRERQVEPVYLTSEPIFDIGSAIPLMEKN